MAQFTANRGSFTPVAHATNADNYVLSVATVGQTAKVKMFNWGGRGTTSTGYRTRWGRVNNTAAGAATALTATSNNPNAVAMATAVHTYATTVAAIAADPAGLFAQDWNVLGGGGVVVLPIGGEWLVVGGALGTLFSQIACGNIAGADAGVSSYGITWEE